MKLKTPAVLCVCLISVLSPISRADDPLATLRELYPEIRVQSAGQRYTYIYGTPMTPGVTAARAAADFLEHHGRAYGSSGELQFRELWSTPARDGRFTVFAYRQQIRGKDVDGSVIRVKVKSDEGVFRVDYAAGRVAGEPTQGSEIPLVPAQIAADFVRLQPGYGTLAIVGEPELVVLRGTGERTDSWCWRVTAQSGAAEIAPNRTYFVDTSLPRIAYVRDNLKHFDPPTTGSVEAEGMPAAYPWIPYQGNSGDLVTHRIPGIRVNGTTSTASGHAFANSAGEFSLAVGQTNQSIAIDTTVSQQAQWYRVFTYEKDPQFIAASAQATVGDTVPLPLFNTNMTEERRVAQADTVVTANRGRAFFIQYISSTVSGLTYIVNILPNDSIFAPPCNGYAFPGSSSYAMGFAPSSSFAGCWNFGSHSVAAHEYGHVALFMLDDALNFHYGFHEGFADTFGNMLNDDSVQGRQHYTSGSNFREDPTSSGINCQYPLSSNSSSPCDCDMPHKAGQLLSGPWVRIRTQLKSYYGSSAGLEYARVLFGNWTLVTLGGDDGCLSAHPGTLAEVLSVTESAVEQQIICCAFAAHSMTGDCSCP